MRDDLNPRFDYAEAHSGPIPDYLLEVERQTFLKTLAPQMLSGRLQGRLLALFSKLVQPSTVLDLGTFTGYSALCLAEGLAPMGRVHTIEGNPELAWLARQHFVRSPYHDQIKLHEGQALEVLFHLPEVFDLIFLDGDKRRYPAYFTLLVDRLSPGGLLLADNVLWDGRVDRKPNDDNDPDVLALREYNELLQSDARVETVVLPLRDGLSVARRL